MKDRTVRELTREELRELGRRLDVMNDEQMQRESPYDRMDAVFSLFEELGIVIGADYMIYKAVPLH